MIPANQAEALILQQVRSLSSIASIEQVDLLSAAGRILAETIAGKLDIPHWDNSAMDGYAVRYHDVQTASSTQPVSLAIIESIPAGVAPQQRVEPGQAARIFTGSMMPAGADTIVIQEETTRQTTPEGDRVTVLNAPQPQAFVRHRAAFYQAGQPLLQPGIRLSAADIALLATVQCQSVPVFRRPRVAVLSTGNELVTPDAPLLQPGQIVDSNQYAIATLLTQAGAEPILLGIVPDDPNALRKAIATATFTKAAMPPTFCRSGISHLSSSIGVCRCSSSEHLTFTLTHRIPKRPTIIDGVARVIQNRDIQSSRQFALPNLRIGTHQRVTRTIELGILLQMVSIGQIHRQSSVARLCCCPLKHIATTQTHESRAAAEA